MIRVVIDTNLIVRALINYNAPNSNVRAIFESFFEHKIINVTSKPIIEEIYDVLNRNYITKLFKISQQEKEEIIRRLIVISYVGSGEVKLAKSIDDPDDNMVIEAAIEGHADYIITGDDDLLRLKEYQGIKIITAKEFLDVLKSSQL